MKKPIVTVFGGSGFLGRHVVRALALSGYRLRVGVRQPYAATFLSTMGEVGQIQLVRANIRCDDDVAAAVRDATAVVNVVGAARPWGGEGFRALHLTGAIRVARSAMEAGAETLVHVSAIDASLETPSRRARIRARAEFALRDAFPAATVLRPARVFGPEDRFLNRMAARARVLPALGIRDSGRLQPVYVGDVASAVVCAIHDPARARGRTYELAGPNIFSPRELAAFVLKQTGRDRRLFSFPTRRAQDDVMRKGALSLADLGIAATPVAAIAPGTLSRFRPKGQYQAIAPSPVRLAAIPSSGPQDLALPEGLDASLWTGRTDP